MQVETRGQAAGAECCASTRDSSNCECDQLAVKLASSEAVSPSGLVTATRYLPAFRAGVATLSYSYPRTLSSTDLPPMAAVAPV